VLPQSLEDSFAQLRSHWE
jgi:hypothetical protein